MKSSPSALSTAKSLMEGVYGSLLSPHFPRPMLRSEAGLCGCVCVCVRVFMIVLRGSANGQRRYLWTDAFGLMTLVAMGESAETGDEAKEYSRHPPNPLRLARSTSLPAPNTDLRIRWWMSCTRAWASLAPKRPVTPCTSTRAGSRRLGPRAPFLITSHTFALFLSFVGLRIGKVETAEITDCGMELDGCELTENA
jgi:hypothetical protein